MRHVLIAAAALAFGGFATTAAVAQQGAPAFEAGGPVKVGNMCKVDIGDPGDELAGYYKPCGQEALASAPRRKR